MRYELEPANTIIRRFGGLKPVAKIVGVSPHSVMRWRYPRHKKGTGGAVPHWHQGKLLIAAKDLGIDLSPAEFFPEDRAA
jgi:hypothetical protein